MSSIHGHEVLHMMAENNYTELTLLEAIEQKFGRDALFYTYTKTNMNAKQLVELLKLKGKFKPANEREFSVDSKKICHH